jgi:hypothetical protein
MPAKKAKSTVFIALFIPIFVVLSILIYIFALQRYVPLATLEYNFLYTEGNNPYTVSEGKIQIRRNTKTTNPIFLYDTKTDRSQEISFESAQTFELVTRASPDGYTIVTGKRSEGIFPFFSRSKTDYTVRYVTLKGNTNSNFLLIGWIN